MLWLVNLGEVDQFSDPGPQFMSALCIEKTKSHGARHSEPAVVRRAPAQANKNLRRASAMCVQDHFADTKSVGERWVARGLRYPSHSGCLTHFHHRQLLFFNPAVTRIDLPPKRIVR